MTGILLLLLLLLGCPKFLINVNSGVPGRIFGNVAGALVKWWYLMLMLYADWLQLVLWRNVLG